jgi:hypothetical protein
MPTNGCFAPEAALRSALPNPRDRHAVERSWTNGAGFFRRNLDQQISKSPKSVLSDEIAPTPNGKPIVIARGSPARSGTQEKAWRDSP